MELASIPDQNPSKMLHNACICSRSPPARNAALARGVWSPCALHLPESPEKVLSWTTRPDGDLGTGPRASQNQRIRANCEQPVGCSPRPVDRSEMVSTVYPSVAEHKQTQEKTTLGLNDLTVTLRLSPEPHRTSVSERIVNIRMGARPGQYTGQKWHHSAPKVSRSTSKLQKNHF